MVFINTEECNGCGVCIDICPTEAITLQNGKAFIDTNLCDGCEVCMDTCLQGAIVHSAIVPLQEKTTPVPIEIPTVVISNQDQESSITIQNAVYPVIGSMLLWTGRELVPRMANLVLDYLERRIQPTETGLSNNSNRQRGRRFASPAGGRRRRQRQRRRKDFQVNERR